MIHRGTASGPASRQSVEQGCWGTPQHIVDAVDALAVEATGFGLTGDGFASTLAHLYSRQAPPVEGSRGLGIDCPRVEPVGDWSITPGGRKVPWIGPGSAIAPDFRSASPEQLKRLGGNIFVNPEYDDTIGKSLSAVANWANEGGAVCWALVKVSTGALWFHDQVFGRASAVYFSKGRIAHLRPRFDGMQPEAQGGSSIDSVLAVYSPGASLSPSVGTICAKTGAVEGPPLRILI